MTEADLIKKVQSLKQIKPRKDWVVLTKQELFIDEIPSRISYRGRASGILEILPRLFLNNLKPALATFVFIGIIMIAAFSLAQNSLPGDPLYSLKRVTEKARAALVLEAEKPKAQLQLANKRLEELTTIAETNQPQKLAPAINEVQQSFVLAAKGIKEPQKLTKEIVQETKKLQENKEKIEALGVVIGEVEELDNAMSQLVEREIKNLEERILSEEKALLLEEAKEDFEAGDFSAALEKVWLISN